MEFKPKHFDPLKAGGAEIDDLGNVSFDVRDEGDEGRDAGKPEDVYVYSQKAILALNVAMSTNRPLLISGEPGSGKSVLALNAASVLGWWYYKQTITSKTQASDLLWTFDALRRLSDAHMTGQKLLDNRYYVDPGPLWWAFDPKTAGQRGSRALPADHESHRAIDPGHPPSEDREDRAVVLLDEIDKADPDVPNDLLEPFDLKSFTVRETNDRVSANRNALLILTTNGERELPPAFLRRCVALTLDAPTKDWFVKIADEKYGTDETELHESVAQEVIKLREAAKEAGLREPSTGEYLDALEVCRDLGISTASTAWKDVAASVLWKHERAPNPDDAAD